VVVDAGDEARVAAEVEALLALVVRGAPHDVDGLGEVDLGVALLQRDERHRGQVVGSHVLERSLDRAADRGADGVDDDCLRHMALLCENPGVALAGRFIPPTSHSRGPLRHEV